MAYGLKYFSEFADDQEIGYRVEIHERDYSGDETEVTSSGNPFTLEVTEVDNIFSPIRTKKATIEWVATEDVAFEIKELDLADDQKYKVFLYEIGASETLITKFTGYLVTVDCKEPFGSKPYPIQLSAACGLFFLRDYYFTSDGGEFVLDKINIKNTIGQCLQFANLELDFHTYVDIHDIQMGAGDPLALADFAADGLRGLTCYDALSGVLNAINAFVVQEGDVWVIKGIPDSAALVCPRRIYDYQSAFKSQDLPNQAVSIGREPFNGTIPNLIPTENVTTSLAETSSVVKMKVEPGIAVNRLLNGQFAYPITGGNLRNWDINLSGIIYPVNGTESPGWTRSGFGTIDSPYRFEMRGYGILTDQGKDTGTPSSSTDDVHIDIENPIIIDGGLFGVGNTIKLVISGAFRARSFQKVYIECRINDGDRDYVSWLDESGKWSLEKKKRQGIKIDVKTPFPDISIPVEELQVQTFEVTSEPLNNFLNQGGRAIAKIYFRVFPGMVYGDVTPEQVAGGVAPLLAIEDFSVAVTTETIYEGAHTYVVDADLPIRNANEISFSTIVADKINIVTPEQVRLSNRVMTGYMTIHETENLTYGWNRRIGGQTDPIDGIPYPIQYKVLKERIRQVCGKRIVVDGDFLGYDLNASSSVFLQYDDVYDNSKFYTVTNWKWDVINRRYSVKLNELSLTKLSSSQEFIELDKEGSGSRGNRLYGNNSGGSSGGNGSNSADIPDPIELDVIEPLYFVVGETSTHSFDLGELILSGQEPADLVSKFVYYPSWMLYPYEDRGEDGDLLTYTVTGTPTEKGHDQIIIEFTDPYGVDYLAVVPIFIEEPTESLTNIYDTSAGDDLLGSVPGYYFLPDKWDLKTNVLGSHNKVILTVVGGGVSGDEVSFSQTRELEEGTVSSDATYGFFESTNGITTDVGVFKFSVLVYRGNTLISTEYGNFTLYDEEYLAKASNEIYDTSKNELLGVISIDGQNSYKKVDSFDVLTIISDLEHDNIHFTLNKDGVQVFEVDYPSDPSVLEGEYYLFDTVTTEYGAGKYDLIYTVSLDGSDVYQRGASFEFLNAEALPEAGIDLITFKNNTINYSVVDSLPLFNYQADLPDNWGLIIPIPDIDYDYVDWKLYDSTTGGLAEVDIETYTNLPQHISYAGGKTKKDILVFELKNSTDIGDIHRAPSSFRIKAIFKLGGDSGKVTGIRQADFAFRVPLEPEDYSGNRFILVDSTSGSIDVVDSNMPKSGSKYLLPEIGIRWSVSTRSFGGLLFDSVKVRLSKLVSNSYTILHWLGSDYILQYNSPSDVVELTDDDSAYTDGLVNSDGLRYLYDPSNSEVIIDEIGSYKASFEFYLNESSIGISETSFDLIDGTEPPVIPIKDCCGGGDATLPVYEGVEGSYGGEFKTLQVTTTENGTISAIEEIDIVIPGDEIVGLVHNFDVAPKILSAGTDLDSAATYGQVLTALASGSADKSPVKTVATANVSLSGLQTINGYTLTNGDRVLVTAQTNATQNGCYVAASGSWVRATDSDTGAELIGASYLVTQGSLLTNQTKWKVVNEPPITIGSTAINIIQIQGAEIDPTVGLWIKNITSTQITNWDAAYTASTNFNSLFDTRFALKNTNNLVEGTLNKYFTEQRVRDTVLTGLSVSSGVINNTDSVLGALGKLQGQINSKFTSGLIGRVPYFDSTSTITYSEIRYDNTTGFLGIGVNPLAPLQVQGNIKTSGQIAIDITGFAPLYVASGIKVETLNVDKLDDQHGSYYLDRVNHTGVQAISTITGLQAALDAKTSLSGTLNRLPYFNTTSSLGSTSIRYDSSNGWIGIGATPAAALDVVGNVRLTGQLAVDITGFPPFYVASTLKVDRLNSDLLDDQHGVYYLARANHTGVQAISTITGLQTALDGKASSFSGTIGRVPYFSTASQLSNSPIRYDSDTGFVGVGVNPLSPFHVQGNIKTSGQIAIDITGFAPLSVASSIVVSSFNADLLDGQHGTYYVDRANHVGTQAISTVAGLQAALDSKGGALSGSAGRLSYFNSASSIASTGVQYEPSNGFIGINVYPVTPLHVNGNGKFTGQISADITGFAPMTVNSTLRVFNFNSDLLDDQHGNYYLSRANHTGTQAISTITGLQSALDSAVISGTAGRVPFFNTGSSLSSTQIRYNSGNGFVGIGVDPVSPFQVQGNIKTSGQISIDITGFAPMTVNSSIKVNALNVDYLDDQHGSYYLDYNNFTNRPSIPSLAGYALESWVNTYFYSKIDSDNKYYNVSNPSGYISGINSPMVTSALGYTPMPNNRTITINGNTQNLNDSPNFTISSSGGTVTGSGTNGYVTRWTGGSSIGNSRIIDTGSGEVKFNAGINPTHAYVDNTFTAGSGVIYGQFTTASNLLAQGSLTLPTTVESGLSGKGGEASIAYVNSGSGKGLWVNMGSSGWRLIATRSWVGSSGAGSSPP